LNYRPKVAIAINREQAQGLVSSAT